MILLGSNKEAFKNMLFWGGRFLESLFPKDFFFFFRADMRRIKKVTNMVMSRGQILLVLLIIN